MATFDEEKKQIVVRIVYDGAGTAGKTTNLERLTEVLTRSRRGELHISESSQGRTLFFDWLQLEGGLIAGHRYRCELLTVPGQRPLRRRRAHLVQSADVVVLVVDSSDAGVAEGAAMLQTLNEMIADRGIPILVQANKQDLPAARTPQEVVAALGLPADTVHIGAVAQEGNGVRDTALLAMRLAAEACQQQVLQEGVAQLSAAIDDPECLREEMRALRIEARDSERPAMVEPDQVVAAAESGASAAAFGTQVHVVANVGPEGSNGGRAALAVRSPEGSAQERLREALRIRPQSGPMPVGTLSRVRDEPAASEEVKGSQNAMETGGALSGRGVFEDGAMPARPTDDVPSRHIWPSTMGRRILGSLAEVSIDLCTHLTHKQGKQDGSGKPDTMVFRGGDWCLKTSPRRRYRTPSEAEEALMNLARSKVLLGPMLMPSTVLSAQPGGDGMYWLWTLAPWRPSLRSDMAAAEEVTSEPELSKALDAYARASLLALHLLLRNEIVLDVNPSNFTGARGAYFYLDDDIGIGTRIPSLGHAWLQRLEEYSAFPTALEHYVATLERGLVDALRVSDVERCGLREELQQTPIKSALQQDAKERLLQALRQCR